MKDIHVDPDRSFHGNDTNNHFDRFLVNFAIFMVYGHYHDVMNSV